LRFFKICKNIGHSYKYSKMQVPNLSKSIYNTDWSIQLKTIEDLRKQKLYDKAYSLAYDLYENHRNELEPLHVINLYNELISNGREMANKYQSEFFEVLRSTRNVEQIRNSRTLDCHKIKGFSDDLYKQISELDKTIELENISVYRKNGKNEVAFGLARYVHKNYLDKLSNKEKLNLYIELISNGINVNKSEGYKHGLELYKWLEKEKDAKNLDIDVLKKDSQFVNNFKYYDDNEHLFDKFSDLIRNATVSDVKNQNNSSVQIFDWLKSTKDEEMTDNTLTYNENITIEHYNERLRRINEQIKKHKTINVKYINGGDFYESFFSNLLRKFYHNCVIKETNSDDCHFVVCSMFEGSKKITSDKAIRVFFNGEPTETDDPDKCDFVFDTKINEESIYIPFYVTSFYERRKNVITDLVKPIQNVEKTKFCAYMSYVCYEHREEFFTELSRYKQVDPLGKCMRKRVDNVCKAVSHTRWTYESDLTFYDRAVDKYLPYKFVIAFEKTDIPGYITEKIINPILAGAIPIYWGTSDVKKHFNPKRFIFVQDFEDIQSCIKYIEQIDQDDQLYQQIINEPFLINNDFNEYCLEHPNNPYVNEIASLLEVSAQNQFDQTKDDKIEKSEQTFDDIISAYVINLDERTDRWNALERSFKNIKSVQLVRFSALKGQPGWHYCGFSHQQILREHQNDNTNILVFEDDCLLRDPENFDSRWTKIKNWLDDNDDRWDIFLGGTSHVSGSIKIVNDDLNIVETMTGYCAHFIYYNKKYIKQILKWKPKKELKFDLFRVADPRVKILTSVPFLAGQSITFSNLENKVIDLTQNFIISEKMILDEIERPGLGKIPNELIMCNITDCMREDNMNENAFLITQMIFNENYDNLTTHQKMKLLDQMIINGYLTDKIKTNEYVQKWLGKLKIDDDLNNIVKRSKKLVNNLKLFGVTTF